MTAMHQLRMVDEPLAPASIRRPQVRGDAPSRTSGCGEAIADGVFERERTTRAGTKC